MDQQDTIPCLGLLLRWDEAARHWIGRHPSAELVVRLERLRRPGNAWEEPFSGFRVLVLTNRHGKHCVAAGAGHTKALAEESALRDLVKLARSQQRLADEVAEEAREYAAAYHALTPLEVA